MQKLKTTPFFLVLLVLFFCLHGLSENIGYISFSEAASTGGYILIGIAVFFAVLYCFSRNMLWSSMVAFFASFFYLFFGAVQDGLKHFGFFHKYVVLLPLLVLLPVLIAFYFAKRKPALYKWTLFLNVLLAVYCLVDISKLALHKSAGRKADQSSADINYAAVKEKPDVYLLLVDEYPGYKSLKDSFGFENDVFYEKLKGNGFTFLPVFSNYNMTPFSMSSVFNMDYVKGIRDPEKLGQTEFQERSTEIKEGRIFDIFNRFGYGFFSYSIFDAGDNESIGKNSFILGHNRLLTDKILHNRLIKDLGPAFVTGKYASEFIQKLYYGDIQEYNTKLEQGVLTHVSSESKPKFIYAHFLMPHQPYFFDSTGKQNDIAHLEDGSTLRNKSMFLSYLKYCNTKIAGIADKIVQQNPGAIIIIMSDHGFRYYNNEQFYEPMNFNSICAVRNPAKPIVPYADTVSNVNVFRLILNADFHQQLPYVKDSVIPLKDIED